MTDLDATVDDTAMVDAWDASTDVAPTSPQPDESGDPGLLFNNYTKDEVAGLHDQVNDDGEDDDPRAEQDPHSKKKRSKKSTSTNTQKGSKRARRGGKDSLTGTKKPRRRKRARARGNKKGTTNTQSQPNLMSVDDMFKLGFGKAPQGHLAAHRGHTPQEGMGMGKGSATGPAGRLFQLTGRAPKETLVDTLLDFPIPDIRSRPKTVSPRTRRAREARWKKMQVEHDAVQRVVSRGSQRPSRVGTAGTEVVEEDPSLALLREKQEQEKREEQEMLAQSMGLSVEEMVALDAAASEGTEEAIQEYMDAFERIDKDGSGSLSPDELREVMHELGEDMNEKELEEMIQEADHDGDGEIDYDEFTSMMRARKRRELLARNMTQAQANHRKDRQHRRHSIEDGPNIPTLNDGSALGNTTQQMFEEFREKYPNNGAPSLPPLQLSRATVAKRHMRDAPTRQFMDQYLTRPTPHVLKTGAAASADTLRIQLTRAQDVIHMLDAKVQEGIEWVQANCPVTNIKAQLYCQKWGLEKLTNLFNKIAYRQMIAALEKWSEYVDYHANQEKAENYMKWKGSRRLVKMLEDRDHKFKAGGWDKWVHVIREEKRKEEHSAATNIERVARGFMGRRRVLNICTGRAAIEIQRVARGCLGRKRYQKIWWKHRREWAAQVIQFRYRGYKGRQLGRIIAKKKKEHDSACILQRAWRGFEGRRLTRIIQLKKLEIKSAIFIQNCWRTRVSRRLVSNMRHAIAEEESALYIQTWWRSVLGYRDGQARLLSHRNQMRREKAAMSIQGCWRVHCAKKKVEQKRLLRACLRVQMAWRCKKGRFTLHLKRAAKAELDREEAEAKELAARLMQEQTAARRLKEQEEEGNAATAIQGRFRQRIAKKNLSQRKAQAKENARASEERALRTRMALRIQCAWRGKQGRLGSHLRAQARKFREKEEADAARAIQSRLRGRQTRKSIREAEETKRKEAERQIQLAASAKAQSNEEERAASKMQSLFRGQQDRSKVDNLRAQKALREQEKHEQDISAQKMQSAFRGKAARKKVEKKKMELLEHTRKQEEAEQAHAALLIQQKIRARSAKNELDKRKELHALELAAETDADARKRLRERQEQEIAAVKLQQLYRSRLARKELSLRKSKLAEEKRRLAQESVRQQQDLAALKIQGMVRKWQARRALKQKLQDREDSLEKRRKEEEEALEQEHAALILQKRMRGLNAKKEVAEKRAVITAERAALEAEEQEIEEQQEGATKLQSMFRAKKAKQKVAKRKAQHDAEMAELQKRNAKEDELAELRLKQEQELAAMKLQAIYRGRKLRIGFDDVKKKRLVEINKRKRKLQGELCAIKIQGMYRSWKARKILHKKMEDVKSRRRVSFLCFFLGSLCGK